MTERATAAVTKTGYAPPPWLLMALLVAGHGVKHVYNAGFFIILPQLAVTFGLSNTALGALSTARSLSGSLTNVPAGFLADRYNRHWSVILGLCMTVIGVFSFITGSVDNFFLLAAAAAVMSGAISFWHPSAIAALSQRFPQRRGFALALHGTGGSAGEALGPTLVGGLLLVVAWQWVLRAGLFPALAMGLLVWLMMRHVHGQTPSELTIGAYWSSVKGLVRNPAVLTILLVVGTYSMVQGAVSTFLPVYLGVELGYSSLEMGAFLSAAQVAGIVSQPILGYLSDRLGRRGVLVPSLALLGCGLVATGFVQPGWPLAVTITLMGAFQFPLMALFLATAIDEVGAEVQGTTVSLVFGAGTIFSSVSPTFAGYLADNFSVQIVFFYAAALAFIASALLAARRHPRPTTT